MPEFKTARRTGFPAGLVLSYLLSSGLYRRLRDFAVSAIWRADYTAGQELHLVPKTVIFSVNYL